MNLRYVFYRHWMIAVAVLVLVLSGCRITGQRLRGNTILDLRLPIREATQQDGISVSSDHIALRSFSPLTVRTQINRVRVPDALWKDLEQSRLDWCQQPPTFVSVTPNDADYRIILKCEQADEDPRYFVHPSDLPALLHALVDLVPSTSERLIPQ
jgi:hypothetical protein